MVDGMRTAAVGAQGESGVGVGGGVVTRTGTRVGVYGDRRSVPVLPELVVDLAQRPEAVDESLRTLLRSPGVQLFCSLSFSRYL